MRSSRNILLCLTCAMMIAPMMSISALADGGWIRYDNDYDNWSMIDEKSQYAIINYHDGIEKMVISIQLSADEVQTSDKIAWLFPVPSNPNDIDLRIMSTVPRLDGDSLGKIALQHIRDDPAWQICMYGSQLYTVPLILYSYVLSLGIGGPGGYGNNSIGVFDEVESNGLTSEVVDASSAAALSTYLDSKELVLPESMATAADEYIGQDYSFVLSWISNVETFVNSAMVVNIPGGEHVYMLGICAEFPTNRIFFPLRMTSAYGDLEIPITVQVVDFVTPREYPSTSNHLSMNVDYSKEKRYGIDPFMYYGGWPYRYDRSTYEYDFKYFFAEQIGLNGNPMLNEVKYTTIQFNGRAGQLTEDLWMDDAQPIAISIYEAAASNSFVFVVALFILISALAGFIAGFLVFRKKDLMTPKRRFALLGLFNILTIAGIFFGYAMMADSGYIDMKGTNEKEVTEIWKWKWTYLGAFTIVFLGLAIFTQMMISSLAS